MMNRSLAALAGLSISVTTLWVALPAGAQTAAAPFVVEPQTRNAAGGATPIPGPTSVAQITEPTAQAVTEPLAQVDETALRYFARQGDTQRVDAEIARLRLLYPDWEPPENLLGNDFTPDPMIERIWERYSAGDFAGARAAIAEKRAADPGWQPTEDMLRSLDLAEAAVRLRNASDAAQHQTVISIAVNTPDLLVCSNVDLLWRLAEAFIEIDAPQRGLDAYTYVLNNCEDPGERLATVQQASERLDRESVDMLVALERMDPQGVGEFDPVRLDLAREAIVDVLAGRMARAEPADIARLENAVMANGSAEDLRLLGWYALNRNRPEDALDWFERAMDDDPSVTSVNGLGVALLALDRPGEAEDALYDYVDETEEITTLYLSAAAAVLAQSPRVELTTAILGRIAEIAYEARDVQTGQEMGWYALAFEQPQTALAWFETALGWDETHEPSAYGVMVASDRLSDAARVEEIRRLWRERSQRIAQFGSTSETGTPTPPPRQAVASTTAVQPTASTAAPAQPTVSSVAPAQPTAITVTYQGCSSYVSPANLSPGQALSRGWCLMDLLRPAEAAEHFGRALHSTAQATRSDAAYGQALAYIRLGLAEHAAVAAAAAPMSQSRAHELQTSILTLTAVAAYRAGDYRKALMALDERSRFAPELNDLLTLRAWSYYNLRRYREAEQIFTAVAATGHSPALAGLEAIRGIPVQ